MNYAGNVRLARSKALFAPRNASFADFIINKWTTICSAVQSSDEQVLEVVEALDRLLKPWGDRLIGPMCAYPSFVSSDGFPAEISVSWSDGELEVRILFEPLGEKLTALACQKAGRALIRALATRPGVSIERYLLLEDLFLVAEPRPFRPNVWLSLAWKPGRFPLYKAYLNPQAIGVERTWDVVSAAMARLGMAVAWQPVALARDRLSSARHELEFFALDLTDDACARACHWWAYAFPLLYTDYSHSSDIKMIW